MALAGAGGSILPGRSTWAFEDEPGAGGRIFVYAGPRARGGVLRGTVAIDPESMTWTTIADEGSMWERVSPDGKALAYCKLGGRPTSIWVADVAGEEEPRKIAQGFGEVVWSPDGKQVVNSNSEVSRGPETFETWRLDVRGGSREKLPIPPTERVIDWSADGRWFLTSSARKPAGGGAPRLSMRPVYAMRTDGSDDRLLVPGDFDPDHALGGQGATITFSPRFSPDGRRIAFGRSVVGGDSGLWVVGLDGQGRRRIVSADEGERLSGAGWSPDGQRLAVTFEAPELAGGRVEIVDAEGRERRPLDLPAARGLVLLDWR